MRSALALAVLLGAVGSAAADEIVFSDMRDGAREKDAVVAAFGKAADGATIQTKLVDLDNDRRAEIFARVVGKKQCGPDLKICPVKVLRWQNDAWETVLSRSAARVDTGVFGYGGMRGVLTDETAWSWTGKAFKFDVSASGQSIELQPAPAGFAKPLLAQFGAGAVKLAAANKKVQVLVGAAELAPGKPKVVIARLEGPGVCGVRMGCPMRVVQVKAGAYESVMEGFGQGSVSIMKSERSGWRDITTQLPSDGFATYGWGGSHYGVADISEGGRK